MATPGWLWHSPGIGGAVIGRRRFQKRQQETGKQLRINERIRKSPVRLIDENNDQVGVIETDDARRRARAVGLDLVEVAPHSDPPVCRIMDYGKWKYQQRKKEQKAKAHAKQSELKEVRLRPGTDEHDLQIKAERARRFLEQGDKVQFTILFRGRQMAHREIGFELFEKIAEQFEDIAHVEMEPRIQGRRMTMTMSHGPRSGGKSGGKEKPDKEKGDADDSPGPSSAGGQGQDSGQAAAPRSSSQSQASGGGSGADDQTGGGSTAGGSGQASGAQPEQSGAQARRG